MSQSPDKLVFFLEKVIHSVVKILAILMVLVIIWGVVDVVWILYNRLIQPPYFILKLNDIFAVFGGFLVVLIGIEIFINITVYLQKDVFHVRIVLATALMAIARKVIIFDFKELEPIFVFGSATVILALSIGYWLVSKEEKYEIEEEHRMMNLTTEQTKAEDNA